MQERLVFFAKTMFVVLAVLLVSDGAVVVVFPQIWSPRMYGASTVAGTGLCGLGAIWLVGRSRPHAMPRLRLLDAAIMISSGLMIGAGTYVACTSAFHIFVPFAFTGLLVFVRVFVVPGTASWTLALSSACVVPTSAANLAVAARYPAELGMPFPALVLGGTVIGGLMIAVATLGTRVIYGLRREIREARRFGQYTLDVKLGEGGMGVVYKARHALLRRPTAIKLLPPDKAAATDVARFEREVQLTAELTHPNTIAIFDYGRSTDGVFYYVMEYLDGVDLETLVERTGPLPAARVVHILGQICEALDEAHGRNVVHRDIKPANVILSKRGEVPDFVKVVDFGLVKEVERDVNVTAAGTITGTPAYMAPESLTDPDTVAAAADLYAVGAVGYFLLTGKLVFEGRTVLEIVSHHLHTKPVPPSKRTDNAIPSELEALLLSCLSKTPTERPSSARALAEALAALPIPSWTRADGLAWWSTFANEPKRGAAARELEVADTIAVMPR